MQSLAMTLLLLASSTLSAQVPTQPVPQATASEAGTLLRQLQERIQADRKAALTLKDPKLLETFRAAREGTAMADIELRLRTETRPEVRQVLMITRLWLISVRPRPADGAWQGQILKEVPAGSPLWLVDPYLLRVLPMTGPDGTQAEAYGQAARKLQPKNEAWIRMLESECDELLRTNDLNGAEARLEELRTLAPGSEALKAGVAKLRSARKTQSGTPAPAFNLASLDHPKTSLTNATFRGQYVLVDFWATWCGPCKRELPGLHQAWKRFGGKRFQILSLSLDKQAAEASAFRKQKDTPMPWQHAFLEGAFEHPLTKAFGVTMIPGAFLLNPEGKIVATGPALRGARLEETLKDYLGE